MSDSRVAKDILNVLAAEFLAFYYTKLKMVLAKIRGTLSFLSENCNYYNYYYYYTLEGNFVSAHSLR